MQNKSFSCYLIGDDNITLQCASLILARNHQLLGLVSQSNTIKQWCKTHKVPYIKNVKEFEKNHMNQSCDFLFSIANGTILPSSILNYPRIYAINYHNSPLPKYAGLYATTWAILNNERQHAISWHVMLEQIDAGDILKQPWFSIEEDETALSLNLKCYEHAVKAFHELLIEFETGTETLVKQDLSSRSYYGLKNKPEYYGFISWNNSSEHTDRLCRALTFGHYKNELATPKIIINGQVLIIKSYRKLGISSGENPGTIVHISNTDLQITTGSTDIVLYELMSVTGEDYRIEQLINNHELFVGKKVPDIDPQYIQRLLSHPAVNQTRVEQFWFKEFLKCFRGGVSFLSQLNMGNEQPSLDHPLYKTIKISNNLFTLMTHYSKNHSVQAKSIIFGVVLTYIYRLNNYKNFSIGYSSTSLAKTIGRLENILERHVPLTTCFESSQSFSDVLSFIEEEQKRITPYETFSKDVFIRYPEIEGLSKEIDISFTFCDPSTSPTLSSQKKLNFYITEDGSSVYFHNHSNVQSQKESYAFFDNMEHHLHTLLEDVLKYTDKKIFELSILDKDEEHCLLHELNDTDSLYDSNNLLHHDFQRQATETPLSIAAIYNDVTITYEELNRKANQVAQQLISHGVKPGDIIGIYIQRDMYMLISVLGVLKSGAAYLPLDPHYPDKRINYMLSNSQSKVVLTHQASISKHIHGYAGLIIDVEDIIKSTGCASQSIHIATQSSDLAYVIYTSGTTGTPKGVAISHQAACNHMNWMRNAYDFNHNDVFLQKTPFSFDASVWEFFMPFSVGATLVIAPHDAHASPQELLDLVKKNKVSILQLVPSMLREMILTLKFQSCFSLRHIFCGGEVLLPETIHAFYEHHNAECYLHNLYGPTEATIDTLTHTCSPQDATSHISRIGKPISNTKIYILDDHMKLVPKGILGELFISGHGLANGYLHNEDLTQQKFLPNPFDSHNNTRLYKTGDLVKWQDNGSVEYHERRDGQIKIRGFRIEISEIESSLDKMPSIYQCLVKPQKSENGELILCAYLMLRDHDEITATDIRSFLKDELPDYMIPSRFFVVDKLSTTPSGKLDRTGPIVPIKQLFSSKEHLTPQNDIEKTLHNIWCTVLNNKYLGIYDDFFEMGGHSLIAMNIISQIQQQLSIKLSMRTLFDSPTIHSLAIEIRQLLNTNQNAMIQSTLSERIIIPIKESGNQIPIFLIHPIGGSIFWYKALGVYLDEDIPLYGLQDPGLECDEFFFKNIEHMAGTYIKAIQTIQPHGPYIIGGASFGSTVAIEMAKQLQEMNETVRAILSLDGWAEYPALQKDESHFKYLMQEHNAQILEHHKQHQITNSDNLLALQWHREKMLMQYKLPHIKTHLVLFKAKTLTHLFNYDAPQNWWENYITGRITCYVVPGNHESMFSEPHIRTLANKFNDSLNILNPNDSMDNFHYLEAIISEIPVSVYWMNREYVYLGCSNNMAKLLNLPSRFDIVGKTYTDLYDKKSAAFYKKSDKSVMEQGISLSLEEPLYKPDGTKLVYLSSKVPLHNSKGEIIGMLGISTNITERKQMEADLKIAKEASEAANRAKTEFIANMGHDIRTPLTGVIGMAEILENALENKELKHQAHLIHDSGEELLSMLNDILEDVKAGNINDQELHQEPFDLYQCIDDLIKLERPTTTAKHLGLFVEIDKDIPKHIISDRKKIQRILLNLLGNAIKFTQSGHITVTLKNIEHSHKIAKIQFSVSDTGIGIPQEVQSKVFDRFFRISPSYKGIYKGHGLGLYIAKTYVHLLGGQLTVTSKERKGSTFQFEIECQIAREDITNSLRQRNKQSDCSSSTKKTNKTPSLLPHCLLIEDNSTALIVLESIVSKAGCSYLSVTNGEDALTLIKNNDFDLIITDIGLPGISGTEFCTIVRTWEHENKKAPLTIIGLTGHARDTAYNECIASGMNDVFTKPANLDLIQMLIDTYSAPTKSLNTVHKVSEADLPATEDELFQLDHFELLHIEEGINNCGGNELLLREMLSLMASKEIPTYLEQMKLAFSKQDFASIEQLAHKIKGGSVYLGLRRMKYACQYVERYWKTGQRELFEPLYHQAVNTIEESVAYIESWLQGR